MAVKTRLEKTRADEAEKIKEEFRSILYEYDMSRWVTSSPIEAGTSIQGLVHACLQITGGSIDPIPIPAWKRGEGEILEEDKFQKLQDLMIEKHRDWNLQVILNINTRYLIDTAKIQGFHERIILNSDFIEERGKYLREPVGHFVGLGGIVDILKEEKMVKRLLNIRETCWKWGGNQLQLAEDVRKALIRGDGREGGILLLVDKRKSEEARKALNEIGLKIGFWDNGSPFKEE